jgi:hypothetical protein
MKPKSEAAQDDTAAEILAAACVALSEGRRDVAVDTIRTRYPFQPIATSQRRYSFVDVTRTCLRDGFVDRYTGRRLVFPGALRLLSHLMPLEFPFHPNWKTTACHFAYYELYPTIDHIQPVSRGGVDASLNWVVTSMLTNSAKANFTLEELGWRLRTPGELQTWDGLLGWFERWMETADRSEPPLHLRQWAAAARHAKATPVSFPKRD